MSNSNLIIPTSEDSESSDSDSLSYDSSDERSYKNKNHRRKILEKRALINQCTACAGYHDLSECVNRRSNQKYLHYENVRNKFAKDVGFNYRRGGGNDNYRDNYNNNRDDYRHRQRDRYDDRKIEYHRGGDRLKWDDNNNYNSNKR